ncbi:hypothetical protein E2C01_046535 [Portunus trituberculatus]|uniref:Uncharacterized protein n=1 Tax=Portunus trituberculatus TaxID=210409 RepID=A0A5B7G6F0_PORTR|nr:hypothetical protein [Portunus trituberculatus]
MFLPACPFQLHRDICFSVMIPNLLMLSKPPLAPRRFQPCPARYSSPPERPPSCPANRALEDQTCGAVGGQQHRPEPQGHSCSSLGKLYKEAKETREEKLRDSSFWTPGKDKKAVSLCELSSDVFVSLGSLRVAFRSDRQEEKAGLFELFKSPMNPHNAEEALGGGSDAGARGTERGGDDWMRAWEAGVWA